MYGFNDTITVDLVTGKFAFFRLSVMMVLFSPYRYRSLPHDDSIRILRIHPSPRRDAPIRCRLDIRRLSELAPPYEALSYTWQMH